MEQLRQQLKELTRKHSDELQQKEDDLERKLRDQRLHMEELLKLSRSAAGSGSSGSQSTNTSFAAGAAAASALGPPAADPSRSHRRVSGVGAVGAASDVDSDPLGSDDGGSGQPFGRR